MELGVKGIKVYVTFVFFQINVIKKMVYCKFTIYENNVFIISF